MLEVAANHHERLDGTGYPQRLKGEQLSLYTRMSGIVDVYDAVTADRVYKQGMQPTQAFRILLKGINHHFDAELVTKFIKCMGSIRWVRWCSFPTSGWPSSCSAIPMNRSNRW